MITHSLNEVMHEASRTMTLNDLVAEKQQIAEKIISDNFDFVVRSAYAFFLGTGQGLERNDYASVAFFSLGIGWGIFAYAALRDLSGNYGKLRYTLQEIEHAKNE